MPSTGLTRQAGGLIEARSRGFGTMALRPKGSGSWGNWAHIVYCDQYSLG